MPDNIKVAVLGEDARTRAIGERLLTFGVGVRTCGADCAETAEQVIAGCHAVILPTPAFVGIDVINIFPGQEKRWRVADLLACVGERKIPVFGGRIPPAVSRAAIERGVRLVDYMAMEEVQIRNAVPTAEGAIFIAMELLDRTLDGAQVAILGYGRIGFALAERLHALGASVTVAVRKRRDVARLQNDHLHALPIVLKDGKSSLDALADGYDVIFNTIPYRLIDRQSLQRISDAGSALIELASAPGGWDPAEATMFGDRVRYAGGLPAIYAPRSAGNLIADALLPYLEEVKLE